MFFSTQQTEGAKRWRAKACCGTLNVDLLARVLLIDASVEKGNEQPLCFVLMDSNELSAGVVPHRTAVQYK